MRFGRLLAFAAAACFGALAFFAEVALRAGAAPMVFLTGRFLIAAAILFLAVGRIGSSRPSGRGLIAGFAIGAILYGVQSTTLVLALERADVSVVSILFSTYPAMIVLAVAATSRRDEIRPLHWLTLAAVLAGVVLVLSPQGTAPIGPAAAGLALTSAGCFAAFVVVGDHVGSRVGRGWFTASACCGALVAVTIAAVLTGSFAAISITATGWAAIVGAGIVSTAFAFMAMFAALPRAGTATTGIILGAEPVVTVALGVTVLGDQLSPSQAAGAAIVIGAVAVLGARAPSPTAPLVT